jgi:hypothetical protein
VSAIPCGKAFRIHYTGFNKDYDEYVLLTRCVRACVRACDCW